MAKQRFDKALKLNDRALSGSACTSLATLHTKAPGWPVSFGNKEAPKSILKSR